MPFPEEWLPSGHSTIKAWLVECCRDGCLSRRFLPRGTLELSEWPSGSWSPPWPKAILPRLLSLAGWPALGNVLLAPNFFHLQMMDATVFLGTVDAAMSMLRHNHVSDLRTVPSTSWLGFCSDMHFMTLSWSVMTINHIIPITCPYVSHQSQRGCLVLLLPSSQSSAREHYYGRLLAVMTVPMCYDAGCQYLPIIYHAMTHHTEK